MNKIQYIKLLNLRGITELKGESIADAIKRTGGDPTFEEMIITNEQAMLHFAEQLNQKEKENIELTNKITTLTEERDKAEFMLDCLVVYGVDNWTGYDDAMNDYRQKYPNT